MSTTKNIIQGLGILTALVCTGLLVYSIQDQIRESNAEKEKAALTATSSTATSSVSTSSAAE